MISFKINDVSVQCEPNTTILAAAKAYHVDIPTLCYYPDLDIKSDCRVCSVEIVGQKGLSTACSTIARQDMHVLTNSPRVLNARRTIVELILADHDANCTACAKNLKCELQDLARKLGIDSNRFPPILRHRPVDDRNPALLRIPDRCIKCGRCVDVCKNVQGIGVLEGMGRGRDVVIGPAFGRPLGDAFCTYCGQCSSVCPVGAILEHDDTELVWRALHDPRKHVVVQTAPAVRVTLGEESGDKPGGIVTGKLVAALRLLGFEKVFDTDFTADLTIIEEGNELLERISKKGVLPMMTSCCPGWVNFAEQQYPEILPHVSTCKSPQQMFGALVKTYYAEREHLNPEDIFVVSVMPCTAKKYEAKRPEMSADGIHPDVDVVLTTRELGKMMKQMGIDFDELSDSDYDKPFGETTGAAVIFGATGGVMEAALRTVSVLRGEDKDIDVDFDAVRGLSGIKEAVVELGGIPVRVAVAHSLKNARILAEQVKDGTSPYDFIEVMCCPGGCIGGGGQPYGTIAKTRADRLDAAYRVDRSMAVRKSHENPAITAIYGEYLVNPLGERAHRLLHTHYHKRSETGVRP
ncbi:MAG: NADH-dependent [FeFe] hydrogenase, group A6 [Candidatus Izemoplasmatales bacterium]